MMFGGLALLNTFWLMIFSTLLLFCHSVLESHLSLWDPRDCSMPGSPVLHCLLKFAQIYVHWVGDVIHPSHSLSPLSPPAFNLSQHQSLFQWVGSSHQVVSKYWSFSFSISPSNEYSGLISFRIAWFDLAVQKLFIPAIFVAYIFFFIKFQQSSV